MALTPRKLLDRRWAITKKNEKYTLCFVPAIMKDMVKPDTTIPMSVVPPMGSLAYVIPYDGRAVTFAYYKNGKLKHQKRRIYRTELIMGTGTHYVELRYAISHQAKAIAIVSCEARPL